MKQTEFFGTGTLRHLNQILNTESPERVLLVTGKGSFGLSGAEQPIMEAVFPFNYLRFSDFATDPKFEDVLKGLKIVRDYQPDLVIAVGGGSVIDMAKLLNILSVHDADSVAYIRGEKKISKKGKALVAIPTTSGSGSEATQFIVVYVDKKKYSVAHEYIIPDYAIVDPELTLTTPEYIAAAAGMDAFAQAVESFWSINSTNESQQYSEEAIKLCLENFVAAVTRKTGGARFSMARAANLAGKAINIAKTTAAHALSYSLTSYHGITHGHAVGLALAPIFEYNAGVNNNDCNDQRGVLFVKDTMNRLCSLMKCLDATAAKLHITAMMKQTGLETSFEELGLHKEDIINFTNRVNLQRLKNNPRDLSDKAVLMGLFLA
ncbi:MAG: phosphonoacetaldehyde reductase [Deltaproteobacteria bacterium]|nr:phosphonoacetaldehyde reductase [Deltaproteobacteria bacterium]